MAVQARHLSHDLPQACGSLFFDFNEYAGCAPQTAAPAGIADMTALSDLPGSELTGNYGFPPRKRARVADAGRGFLENHRVFPPPECLAPLPATTVGNVESRAAGSVVASTSGRSVNGATHPLFDLGSEIDALITLESERMREGLEETRRRHAGALLAAACRAASGRLRAAEAELERALRRNAEMEEKARQVAAECEAWMGVARTHEAVAAGLRATLDQLLLRRRPGRAAGGGDGAGGEVVLLRGGGAAGVQEEDGGVPVVRRRGGERAAAAVPAPVPVPRVRAQRRRVPRLRRSQERRAPCPRLLKAHGVRPPVHMPRRKKQGGLPTGS
ncbi:unnamed protein product [Urochloa humidicola]